LRVRWHPGRRLQRLLKAMGRNERLNEEWKSNILRTTPSRLLCLETHSLQQQRLRYNGFNKTKAQDIFKPEFASRTTNQLERVSL
jgi:hypothetical protein